MWLRREEMPFLTVIIPVYNGTKFIDRTLQTILSQPCHDMEVLLIDDGSTDDSLKKCQSYASDKRIRVLHHDNHGVSYTRNVGIKESKGKVIIFHDQDDLFVENFYTEEMKDTLQKCLDDEIDVIRTGRYVTWDLEKYEFQEVEAKLVKSDADLSWDVGMEFNSYIYGGDFLRDNKIYFYEFPIDLEPFYRHQTVYCARKVLYSNDIVFQIRYRNEDSVSSNWNKRKMHAKRFFGFNKVIKWHKKEHPQDKRVIKLAREHQWRCFKKVVWYTFHSYK